MFRYIFSSVKPSFLSWSLIHLKQMEHRRHCFLSCLALWAAYSSFVGLQYDYRFISFWAESLWRLDMWSNSQLSVSNSAPVILPERGKCMAPFCKQYWRLNPGSRTWKARHCHRATSLTPTFVLLKCLSQKPLQPIIRNTKYTLTRLLSTLPLLTACTRRKTHSAALSLELEALLLMTISRFILALLAS